MAERSIREIAAAAIAEEPQLADNSLLRFLRDHMTPEQEAVLEHLAELDRLELEREAECARAEAAQGDELAAHS